jgi:HD-GYP domain-containing protein (c-di-GMP phosphodiesterase class II)
VNRTRSTLIGATIGAALGIREAYMRHVRLETERLAAATLETLLNAIDANDAETGAHVRRVATYALILARARGVQESGRREIERVALFHDIGKIHEALFDIIHDDAKLTPEEREAIATHPQRGADVLAPLAAFYPELPAGVLSHHERWDGTGYPAGLAGVAIPYAARIVAIADTFDAITATRRYHRGEIVDRATTVIREASGTQFDPVLAAAFLAPKVLGEVCAAMRAARLSPVARQNRRNPVAESHVPNVRFRWQRALGAVAPEHGAPNEVGSARASPV